jgi:hypothetical protein
MNLKHEAILSLNTRIRRLRYLHQALEVVGDSSVMQSMAINRLTEYGLSRAVYDELHARSSEPYSGHFFQNPQWGYEKNISLSEAKVVDNAQRVATGYFELAKRLDLILEANQRFQSSQVYFPLRFLETLPDFNESFSAMWSEFILALLLQKDRDVTYPMLARLLAEDASLSLDEISAGWNHWTDRWLESLIEATSRSGGGSPIDLLRHRMQASSKRTNTVRYAEHVALIRFHWLLDLGFARAEPARTPRSFRRAVDSSSLGRIASDPTNLLTQGNLSEIHYELVRSRSVKKLPAIEPGVLVRKFLAVAKVKGMSNVRLSLIDRLLTCVFGPTAISAGFPVFKEEVDRWLKDAGLLIVKSPRREESYVTTAP